MQVNLVCRECQIAAEAVVVDGEVSYVRCSRCGAVVRDSDVTEMYRDEARRLAIHEVQRSLRRATRGSQSLEYRPSKPPAPRWPFIAEGYTH